MDLSTPVPCVRGHFGKSLHYYQTSLGAQQIKFILGHDPRSKHWGKITDPDVVRMYKYLQRKTAAQRREAIELYIVSRFGPHPLFKGAFPAVSIGLLEPPGFEARADNNDVGLVKLAPEGRKVLLDGLARFTAALDLAESETRKSEMPSEWFNFPVTIYAPAPGYSMSLDELGQIFFDFNYRLTKVPAKEAMALDKSDLYIRLTSELGDRGVIKENGGMERGSQTRGGNSTSLVTQAHLLKFVRGACEGRKAQESDKVVIRDPNLTFESFERIHQKLDSFLNTLADEMGSEFSSRESLHLTSGGWQVMGLVFHDVEYVLAGKLKGEEKVNVYQRLAHLDWSRYNPKWIDIYGEGEPDENGRERLGATTKWGRRVKDEMLRYVRSQCGLPDQPTSDDSDFVEQEQASMTSLSPNVEVA